VRIRAALFPLPRYAGGGLEFGGYIVLWQSGAGRRTG